MPAKLTFESVAMPFVVAVLFAKLDPFQGEGDRLAAERAATLLESMLLSGCGPTISSGRRTHSQARVH